MNDTTRRFLTAIVERVPDGGRIVELRLFPAIRQGGIESGVAVVAVEPPEPVVASDEHPEATAESSPDETSAELTDAGIVGDVVLESAELEIAEPAGDQDFAAAVHDLVDTDVAVEDEEGSSGDDTPVPATYVPVADATDESDVADALDDEVQEIVLNVEREVVAAGAYRDEAASGEENAGDDDTGERPAEVALHVEPDVVDDDSPYADAPAPSGEEHRPILADAPASDDALAEAIGNARERFASPVGGIEVIAGAGDLAAPNDEESIALVDILALPSPDAANGEAPVEAEASAPPEVAAKPRRYAILTARYRLTIKGPDRGKWDVEITHEADAPLDTVERVARGVAKRAGEEFDPEHYSAESLQAALAAPVWATTP